MTTTAQTSVVPVEEHILPAKSPMSLVVRLGCVVVLLASSFVLPQSLLRTFFILFLLGNTMFYFSEYIERMPEKSDNLFLRKESQIINTVLVAMSSLVAIIAIAHRLPVWN